MRVRGGFHGLLAALERGVCDELNADAPFEAPNTPYLSIADQRAHLRRERQRIKTAERGRR